MEKFVRQTLLYDFYGELLTEHQRNIYEDKVINDMSYSEMADIYGISRQGIHDQVKRCDNILEKYESKLQLVEKFEGMKDKVEEIIRLSNELKEDPATDDRGQLIDTIIQRSNELYDSF